MQIGEIRAEAERHNNFQIERNHRDPNAKFGSYANFSPIFEIVSQEDISEETLNKTPAMRKVLKERKDILDKKRKRRTDRERADKLAREKEERKQYERLRAKFGGDQ